MAAQLSSKQHSHSSRDIFHPQSDSATVQQPPGGVGQDNPTPPRERTATHQPEALQKVARTQTTDNHIPRSQKQYTSKRKTVAVTLWMSPSERAELQRIAEQKGVSLSQTGRAFIVSMLERNLYDQHAALLDPIIEKAIGKHMRSYSTRLAVLLVRIAFASEQTRSLVTNILSRQPGVTMKVLSEILDGSSAAAKSKITYKTPQLQDLIEEVEQWFRERGHEHNK
jgi:hypothetical protein